MTAAVCSGDVVTDNTSMMHVAKPTCSPATMSLGSLVCTGGSVGRPRADDPEPAVVSAPTLRNKLRIQNDASPGRWKNAHARLLLLHRLRSFIPTGSRGLAAPGFCLGDRLDPNTLFVYAVVYCIQTSCRCRIGRVPIIQAVGKPNLAGCRAPTRGITTAHIRRG